MIFTREDAPPFLTDKGKVLWAEAQNAGINDKCPICEDERSFASPCDKCIEEFG